MRRVWRLLVVVAFSSGCAHAVQTQPAIRGIVFPLALPADTPICVQEPMTDILQCTELGDLRWWLHQQQKSD